MRDNGKRNDYYSKRVADMVSAMLAYWDKDQVCRFANHAYLDWFGKKSEDMIDKMTLKELLGPLYEKNLPYIKEAYKGNVQVFERDIPAPDGKTRSSMTTYTPDIVNGEVQGIIIHVADVSNMKKIEMECKQAKKKAEELATHDFLTGLPNRVYLYDRIRNAVSAAARKGMMIAVFIIDMDDFKNINDSFGHLAGDEVLKEVAVRLKAAVREYDTVSRIGGDEFVILASELEGREQIEGLANRLLEFAREKFIIQDAIIQPSFSIGIAVYPEDGASPESLIKSADVALYQSKDSGKNCYRFCDQCWS